VVAGRVVFQLVSITATLCRATINADLIDNGLLRTDVGRIWMDAAGCLLLLR
jgi:hypothetical protein